MTLGLVRNFLRPTSRRNHQSRTVPRGRNDQQPNPAPQTTQRRLYTQEEKNQREMQMRKLWYTFFLKPHVTVLKSKHFMDVAAEATSDLVCHPIGVEEIPVKTIKLFHKLDKSIQHVDAECSICLVEYQAGERIIQSADMEDGTCCNHVFHEECMMEWLERGHKRCPCCRRWFVPGAPIKQQMKEARVGIRQSVCNLYDKQTRKRLVALKEKEEEGKASSERTASEFWV
ncbi:zinc ion binding [Seminavis robusta]|uniref:Zinc ion binding n=1 Tax=Seminavis robusta TaxID=568900 RepID=A0A9N8EBT3_9STRA|nr:zinc ion binding [Seminavis robusta]|eukprot:Sro939_g222490.1 zinc ion binding (229) ;mRNA; r:38682-39368